jgi:hypothetical protein
LPVVLWNIQVLFCELRAIELQPHLVSILTFPLFDCLAEGIATLFVFGHIPSHLSMVKCSGSCFQCCANAAIYPQFQGFFPPTLSSNAHILSR